MKLSEAIRLGAMLKPQALHVAEMPAKSCALLAAAEAVGIERLRFGDMQWQTKVWPWPWSERIRANCPGCDARYSVGQVIAHINDTHKWTREQIADWVATIEAQHESQPEPQPVSVEV